MEAKNDVMTIKIELTANEASSLMASSLANVVTLEKLGETAEAATNRDIIDKLKTAICEANGVPEGSMDEFIETLMRLNSFMVGRHREQRSE